MKFYVTEQQVIEVAYVVEANSEKEAVEKVHDMSATQYSEWIECLSTKIINVQEHEE